MENYENHMMKQKGVLNIKYEMKSQFFLYCYSNYLVLSRGKKFVSKNFFFK